MMAPENKEQEDSDENQILNSNLLINATQMRSRERREGTRGRHMDRTTKSKSRNNSSLFSNKLEVNLNLSSSSDTNPDKDEILPSRKVPSKKLFKKHPIRKTGSNGSLISESTDDSNRKSKRYRSRWWNQNAKKKRPKVVAKPGRKLGSISRNNSNDYSSYSTSSTDSEVDEYCHKCGKILNNKRRKRRQHPSYSKNNVEYRSRSTCRRGKNYSRSKRMSQERKRKIKQLKKKRCDKKKLKKTTNFRRKCCFERPSSSD